MNLSKVIVIGGNHYNTLGVIRSLGELKIPVYLILISKKGKYISKSKYLKEFWQLDFNQEMIIKLLINEFEKEKSKPVIIPTSDEVMELLDRNFNVLKDKYIIPNINYKEGEVSRFMDKKYMSEIAEKAGMIVPKSIIYDFSLNNINLISEVTYPCILKPIKSVDGRKDDIKICENYEELRSNIDLFLFKGYKSVLIQEYVDGDDSIMLEVIGCRTINSKEIIIPGIIEKKREYPLNAGSTSYAKIVDKSRYLEINPIIKFINNIHYYGIFDFEFKYANGKTYFIEINFRNGAPSYGLSKLGMNIPYVWYLDAIGENIDKDKYKIKKEANIMMEVRDIRHLLNRDIKFRDWIIDLFKTNSFLFLNIKDIYPCIYSILER